MATILEYLDDRGRSPFGRWFSSLSAPASAKITTALTRLEGGNTSALKPVGQGVSELKIDFGPGYRVYLGQVGDELVILVGGGSKARQNADNEDAQTRWKDYRRKRREE